MASKHSPEPRRLGHREVDTRINRLGESKTAETRVIELRELLNDCNPIGASCPPDEYGSLADSPDVRRVDSLIHERHRALAGMAVLAARLRSSGRNLDGALAVGWMGGIPPPLGGIRRRVPHLALDRRHRHDLSESPPKEKETGIETHSSSSISQ